MFVEKQLHQGSLAKPGAKMIIHFWIPFAKSALIVWVIGLSLPILVRVINRKPLSRLWAISFCIIWWFVLILGTGAINPDKERWYTYWVFPVTAVSYIVLRKKVPKSQSTKKTNLILCPSCNVYQDATKKECPNCGYEFPNT